MRQISKKLPLLLLIVALLSSGCMSRNQKPTPDGTSPIPRANAGKAVKNPGFIEAETYDVSGETLEQRTTGLNSGNYGNGDGSNIAGAETSTINPNSMATVFFGFDQSAIAPNERVKLQNLAQNMRADSTLKIVVEGHCDWRGTVEYNMALSERRAKSVVKYLTSLGIDKSRFEVLPKGDLESTAEGTADQMATDRRADAIPLR